jgi:hypothetical protein
MSISEIQKKKFLENIYRLMYSTGVSANDKVISQPDENEIKKEFDEYFSANRIGSPLSIDVNVLRNTAKTDPDLMNIFMARSLLNLEFLYDSLDDNTKKLMNVVTLLNKKIKNLKDKRASLEKKIDNLLFSNSNTDGYFYSFSDSFANLDNIDLSFTNAFVDTENRKVTLPKLKSSALDLNSPGKISTTNITYSIYFNGATIVESKQLPDYNNILDGLTNTKCMVEYSSGQIGSCAMVINIPLSTPFIVSKVDGKLATSSAVTVIAEIIDALTIGGSQFRRKQSNSDYDRFSFDFSPQSSGAIKITLIKNEADYISDESNKYTYNFTIRDLIVSGQYYDASAVVVSSPLSIPSGDANKVIDAVSIEAVNGNPSVGDVTFFVAEDVPGAISLSDFNWIPISSSATNDPSYDQVVSFDKSVKSFFNIKSNPSDNEIQLYPLSTNSNLSLINPSTSIYNGVSSYRIGSIPSNVEIYNPFILDAINNFSFKYVSYSSGLYLDKNRWSEILNKRDPNVNIFEPGNIEITNSPSIPIALNLNSISGFLQTSLLVDQETIVNNVVSKSGNAIDWNVAIFLNGTLVADIQSGLPSKEISWNFIPGINDIVVTFDSEGNSSGSISLMSGVSLSSYGTAFLNYYSYVDPFDFRVNRNSEDKVFTIDNYLGNREIISRKYIQNNSRIVYRSNDTRKVEAIRFRANITRFSNPFGTPTLNSYRVKFKNSI